MEYTNSIKNQKILESLPNHEVGEVIYLEDENKFMTYAENNEWVELDTSKLNINNERLSMSEYELCKMSLASAKTLTEEELKELATEINKWDSKENECYLLYGQEKHIFDFFQKGPNPEYNSLAQALFDTLKRFGEIYRIDFGDNGLEIWIKYQGEEPTFLMLMEWGVITYE